MAVRFNGSSESLSRTTNLIDYTSAYTMMCWAYISTDTNTQTTILSTSDGSLNSFDLVGHDTDGTSVRLTSRTGGGGPSNTSGTSVTAGTWQHYTLRRNSATSVEVLLNGISETSNTINAGTRPSPTIQFIGRQVAVTTVPLNGRVSANKEWSVALTDEEILSEMNSTRPVRLANLVQFSPHIAGKRSEAYVGVDWTENGTLSDEEPPPISWGNQVEMPQFVAVEGAITSSGVLTSQSATMAGTALIETTSSGSLASQSATMSGTVERELTSSGSLVAQSALMSGTAATGAVFTSSGTLASQDATMSGSATRELTTSGSLNAQSATMSGVGVVVKTSSGALQSASATMLGTAATFGGVNATGTMQSQVATMAGTAEIGKTSSGVLQAQSSTMSGTANVAGVVTSSGSLVSQSAIMNGLASSGGLESSGTLSSQAATMSGEATTVPNFINGVGSLVLGHEGQYYSSRVG